MKTRAAIIREVGADWSVEEINLGDPGPGEVIVDAHTAGLCHSDEHLVTGDLIPPDDVYELMGGDGSYLPCIGGHEGSGVVAAVGEGVTSVEVGDHVSASFIPSCGRCHYCSTGHQNLCDLGASLFLGGMMRGAADKHHTADGEALRKICQLGTFSENWLCDEDSVIKVEKDLPLDIVALVSCGVATGWGSAVHRAEVAPGETVCVVGTGGIGMNAVQGAKMAGAANVVAIDPAEFKREKAQEFGATHTFASMEEALAPVTDMTWGRLADKVILTPGVLHGDMLAPALALTGKNGTVVCTAIAPMLESDATLSLFELAMYNKQIKGSIFGSGNPRSDIPNLLMMYRNGQIKLDELITGRYSLDNINVGYQDMRDDKNIRGVIEFA